ncbi:MAG: PAS domain S-box protein [Bacteroidia bacterium]|nr:PAS domain S-box protein [Bacteroidia bacterium]
MKKTYSWLFSNLPGEFSSEFQMDTLKENVSRIKTFTVMLMIIAPLLIVVDLFRYAKGMWTENIAYGYIFCMNLLLLIINATFAVLLLTRRRKDNPPPEYIGFVWFFIFFNLLWSVIFTMVEQYTSQSITSYAIGCFVLAIGIFMNGATGLIIYSISFFIFIAGLYQSFLSYQVFNDHIMTAGAIVFITFIISRITYNYKIELFLNQKKIERELIEKDIAEQSLQKLNTNLENIVKERTSALIETNEKLNKEIIEKKQLENKLIQEKNVLNNIIELNPYSIAVFDKNGIYIKGNTAGKKLFGYEPPHGYCFFSDPLFKDSYKDFFDRLSKGETVYFPEIFYNPGKLNPSYPDINVCTKTVMFPIKNMNGEIENYIQIHEDITDRKNAEVTLKENEEKYRLLVENVNEGIYSTLRGYFISVNRAMEQMFGFNREELVGMPVWNLATPEKREEIKNLVFKKPENKDTSPIEVECMKKNGDTLFVEIRVNWTAENGLTYGMVSDITERKLADEALKESEENYRLLIENISEVIFTLNMKGNITYISPLSEKITDYKVDEIIGKSFIDFVFPEDVAGFLKNYSNVLSGEIKPHEFRLVYKNGGIKYVRTSSRLIIKEGQTVGMIGVMTDVTEQKSAEKSLLMLESAINQSMDGIAITDMEGRLGYVNAAWAKMHGYTIPELIEKKINVCHTQEQLIRDVTPFNKQVIRDGSYQGEVGHMRKDGSTFQSLMSTTLLKDEKGKPIGLIGIAHDITEKRKTEEALLISEKKYRSLFDNAPSGILSVDLNGNIIEINQALIAMLGSPSVEATKQINILTFPNLIEAGLSQKMQECIATGEAMSSEHLYASRWGKKLFLRVNITPVFDEEKNVSGIQGIIDDITQYKQAEKQLQESEEKYRRIVELANEGIGIINTDNKLIFVNGKFAEMLGYSCNEMIGMSVLELKFPEDWDSTIMNLEKKTIDKIRDIRFRKKDGTELWSILSSSIISDSNNNYLGSIAMITDNTEHRIMEHELIKAKEKAEESERTRSVFLANITHEVRMPMNAIIGFSHLLKKPDLSPKKRDYFIETIKEKSTDLLKIINDIIDISQIEAKTVKIASAELSLNKLMGELHDMYSQNKIIITKKIKLIKSTALPDKQCTIITDDVRLKQIFSRLLDNSVKFTHYGKIEFGYKVKEDEPVLFYVSDTGVGIAPYKQKFIFERLFYHSDKKTTAGTSLGLMICKGFIEIMGGHIWVESEEGRGSSFYFTLPFRQVIHKKTTQGKTKKMDI